MDANASETFFKMFADRVCKKLQLYFRQNVMAYGEHRKSQSYLETLRTEMTGGLKIDQLPEFAPGLETALFDCQELFALTCGLLDIEHFGDFKIGITEMNELMGTPAPNKVEVNLYGEVVGYLKSNGEVAEKEVAGMIAMMPVARKGNKHTLTLSLVPDNVKNCLPNYDNNRYQYRLAYMNKMWCAALTAVFEEAVNYFVQVRQYASDESERLILFSQVCFILVVK